MSEICPRCGRPMVDTDPVGALRARCRDAGIRVSVASDLIREADAARLLDVCSRTLRFWRAAGTGPRAVRAGGGWRYPLGELAAFLTPPEEGGRSGWNLET